MDSFTWLTNFLSTVIIRLFFWTALINIGGKKCDAKLSLNINSSFDGKLLQCACFGCCEKVKKKREE